MDPWRFTKVGRRLRTTDTNESKRKTTLYRRGGGTLAERRVAGGSLADMIKRFMQEEPNARREFLIMSEGMEYQSAEIRNLAGQHIFSSAHASENTQRDALLDVRAARARTKI